MASNIYALLVGINGYKEAPLQGCINDVTAIGSLLDDYIAPTGHLHKKQLTDEDPENLPTRENIIQAFNHFNSAEEGDICLFYFAGHGANVKAPAAFDTDAATGALQVIICHDWASEVSGKGYIVDKELSFLIWEATHGKNGVDFIAITDCCHSFSNTRDVASKADLAFELTPRGMAVIDASPPVEAYHGFNKNVNGEPGFTYKRDEAGNITHVAVNRGPHIHISAAMDNEVANELKINGTTHRGALSFTLEALLKQYKGISYRQLVEYAALNIKNYFIGTSTRLQNPGINVNNLPAVHVNRAFLSTEAAGAANDHSVFFDKEYGWCFDAGRLYNISPGDRVVVQLNNTDTYNYTIVRASLLYSVVVPLQGVNQSDGMLPQTRYNAFIAGACKNAIAICFDSTVKKEDQAFITSQQYNAPGLREDEVKYPNIQLVRDVASSNNTYLIAAQNGDTMIDAVVTAPDGTPIIEHIPLKSIAFLTQLNTYAKWNSLLALTNPYVGARYNSLFTVECATAYGDNGYVFTPGNLGQQNELTYFNSPNGLKYPCFRLRVRNESTQAPLYVSAAWLDASFGIQTSSSGPWQDMQVDPEYGAYLMYGQAGNWSNNFELSNNGREKITEYLKLFVSTQQIIPLYTIEQAPTKQNTRSAGRVRFSDTWQAITVVFVIYPAPTNE